MPVLVDADIICYRTSFKAQSDDFNLEELHEEIDDMIDNINVSNTFGGNLDDLKFFLTGENNFRYDIATIAPYKGHRSKEKPPMLPDAKEYLVSEYNSNVSDGQEADDDIAIAAAACDYKCTVASIDKDFLQLPCRHYNWNKDSHTDVTFDEGMKFFYTQMLTGDTADNIKGVKGIGPKKADKILDGLVAEADLYKAVEEHYDTLDELVENARLLWLRRFEGQMWEPPE